MRYAELQALLSSSIADAWRDVEIDGPEVWVLADDVRVSLRAQPSDSDDGFAEPWALVPADPHARRQDFDRCVNGETIIRHLFVTVDGGRCALPLPVTNKVA